MRTRHPALHAKALAVEGQGFDVARQRVVRFVAMHVDHQPPLTGEFAQQAHGFRAVRHGALEMRDAAHHVDAHGDRALQIVEGAGTAQDAVLRERHQLQIEIRRHLPLDVEQRFDGQQARVADIDVRADGQQATRHGPVAVLQGAVHQCLLRQLRFQLAPQGDAFEQGSGGVYARQAIAERGVHVEVGVDERRRDEVALGVDLLRARHGQGGADGGDAAALDGDIDGAAPVGQAGIADDKVHADTPSVDYGIWRFK
ncbi:hypothetical protein D3C81_1390560 [compost metagenome]